MLESLMSKKDTGASEQLAECKQEVAALKHDLAEVWESAPSGDQLHNSGLRLEMENAALREKIAALNEKSGAKAGLYV
jgi:hypothetical protein